MPAEQLNPNDVQGCIYHASMLIANECKREKDSGRRELFQQCRLPRPSSLDCGRPIPGGANPELEFGYSSETSSPRKRKRDDAIHEDQGGSWKNLDDEDSVPLLPSEAILEAIVEIYFAKIQPWIPFLHMPTFRARVKDPRERPKIKVLLHALVSATMKHLKLVDFGIDRADMRRQVRTSRNVVTLNAMGSISVENLQALIVLAFDYVSSSCLYLFTADTEIRWETAISRKLGQLLGPYQEQLSIFS